MGNFRFRNLERYKVGGTGSKMQLRVPAPTSPSGKVYQECPRKECSPRLFTMGDAPEPRAVAAENAHLAQRSPGPGETICPYCGGNEADASFVADMDVEAVKQHIAHAAVKDVEDYLADMARDFNRKMSGGLISMKMSVKSSRNSPPLAIREDLLRDLTCHVCSRSYGVYAIALFCPDCGAPALAGHFEREVELVRKQTALAEKIKDEGEVELAYRLLGNAHEDVVTAFETAQKTAYRYLVRTRLPERAEELGSHKAIGNAFQNVERSRSLLKVLKVDPFERLSAEDMEVLRLNIEKRHVIGHNLSMADDRFAALTEDEQPGRTIQILRSDVERFATAVTRVVEAIEPYLRPPAEALGNRLASE